MENTKTLPMSKRILCAILALVLAMGICIPVIPHSAYAGNEDGGDTAQILEPVTEPSADQPSGNQSGQPSGDKTGGSAVTPDGDNKADESGIESDEESEIVLLGEEGGETPIDPVVQAIDMAPYLNPGGMQIVVNNTPYSATQRTDGKYEIKGLTLHAGDKIKIKVAFGPKDNGVPVKPGQKVFLEFDSNYFKNLTTTQVPIMQGDNKVGIAYINADGMIEFVPDPVWVEKNLDKKTGTATLYNNTVMVEGVLGEKIGGTDPHTYNVLKIGNIDIILPMDDTNVGTDASIEKDFVSFDNATREATYSVKVKNTSDKVIKNLDVTDNFSASAKAYLEKINGNKYYKDLGGSGATVHISDNSKTAKWSFGTINPGETKTIQYKVKFSYAYFDTCPDLTNTAVAKWADKTKEDTETTSLSGVLKLMKDKGATPYIYEGTDGKVYIKYKITVTAPAGNTQTFTNVTVEDYYNQGGDAVDHYVLPANTNDVSVEQDNKTGHVVWTIGEMKPGDQKVLEYEVQLKEEALKGGTSAVVEKKLRNTADLKIDGTTYSSDWEDVDLKKEWIEKSGHINDDNTVSFNIILNKEANGLPAFEGVEFLEDTVSGNFTYKKADGTENYISVEQWQNGAKVGEAHKIPFSEVRNGADNKFKIVLADYGLQGAYEYHVSYTANPLNPNIRVVDNKAIGGVGPGEGQTQTYNHEATTTGLTDNGFDVTKKFVQRITDENGNDYIKWATTLTTNGLPKNAVFTDWDTSGEADLITFDQSVLDSIVIKDKDGKVVDSSSYTKELANGSNGRPGFKLTFTKDVMGGNFVVEYVTPVASAAVKNPQNMTDVSKTYKNKSKLEIGGMTDDSEADHTFKYYKPFDKSNGTLDWTTNTLTWKIEINKGSSLSGNANLIEYIPQGLEFVKAEITDRGAKATDTALGEPDIQVPNVVAAATTDHGAAQVVTIPVSGLYKAPYYYESADANNDGRIEVLITTKITDEELLTGKGHSTEQTGHNQDVTVTNKVSKKFINYADLVYNNTTFNDSSEQTVERTILTKESDIAIEDRPDITYKVTINPEGADLLPVEGKTHIELNDRMSNNVSLKNGSIVVKNKNTGEDVTSQCTDIKIQDDFHGFTMMVPDNIPLEISYKASVEGLEGAKVEIWNEAYVFGDYTTHGTTKVEEFVILGASATSDTGANFSLAKSDSRTKNVLAGAKFKLYRAKTVTLDDETKTFVKGEDGKPELEQITLTNDTTGADGIMHFDAADIMDVTHEGVYAYQEYDAPDGYVVDDELHYVEFIAHPDFVNEFNIDPRDITNTQVLNVTNEFKETNAVIGVEKNLSERKAVTGTASDQVFNFTLKYVGAEGTEEVPYKAYNNETGAFSDPVAENNTFTKSIKGSGKANFDQLFHFKASGSYKFELTEDALTDEQIAAGYTHDDTVYEVVVNVTNSAGHKGLTNQVTYGKKTDENATVDCPQGAVFDNGYKLNASVEIPVTKALDGMSADVAEGKEFTFGMFRTNGTIEDGQHPRIATVTMDGRSDQNVAYFDALKFSTDSEATDIEGSVGTYEYEIVEMGEALAGFDENEETIKVQIDVTDSGKDSGKLDVVVKCNGEEVEIEGVTPEGATDKTDVDYYVVDPFKFVITNIYHAEGKVVLEADKKLDGKRPEALKAGEFKFEVKDETGAVVATGTNDANGKIEFTEIEYNNEDQVFTKEGTTFIYTMSEVKGNDPQIKYSDAQIKAEVNVADNGEGELVTTVKYLGNGATFVNTWNDNPKTGDDMPVLPIALIAALSGLVCLISGFAARRRNDAQA